MGLYVTYGTHCTPAYPWKEGSPTLRVMSGSKATDVYLAILHDGVVLLLGLLN